MSRHEHRTHRWVALTIAIFVCSWPVSVSLASSDEPSPTEGGDVTTETTTPDTTPDTTSDTSEPDSTVVDGVPAEDDDANALTWIAIVATVALLGVAVWWMVRSTDRAGPIQPMDDDWPDRSEVI